MGCRVTPEKLSANLGMSKEKIGEALAQECLSGGMQKQFSYPALFSHPEETMTAKGVPYLLQWHGAKPI